MALILSLAIALSLDAFSVALTIGLTSDSKKRGLFFCLIVAVLHYLMPTIGMITNKLILSNILINGNKLLGFILLVLTIQMIIDLKSTKKKQANVSVFLLAFSVSIDSYFTGIGLKSIDGFNISYFLVFSIVSFMFSFAGIMLGKLGKTKDEKKSLIIAIIILLLLSVKYLLL